MSRTPTRRSILASIFTLCALLAGAAEPQEPIAQEPVKPAFREIWAYLMQGEEARLTGSEPVSDVCYFSAELSRKGRIAKSIKRPALTFQNGQSPRVHLVVAELSNHALMHFSLDPSYGVRPLLIDDICQAAEEFDGVQIDFESVSREDAECFFGFLKEIKGRLPPGKLLSIAVPARMKRVEDAYEYTRLSSIADRLVVMAYDEHWSTSSPGPIASLPWCARVADYALNIIPADRLIMGLPLYGRAWQDKRLARALRFDHVQDILAEKAGTAVYAPEQGASYEYSESVVVKVFYDDEQSLMAKLRLYRDRNVGAVSFWRIGQGPPSLWTGIELDRGEAAREAAREADGPAEVRFPAPVRHPVGEAATPR